MLQLYDVNKNKIKGLVAYKDYCIESVLKTGDKTLSFLYPKRLGKEIKNEGYIRNKTDEFVIKSVNSLGDWLTISTSLNVEDLEGKEWESFTSLEQTIQQCLTLACAGTGWTVNVTGVTKKRTIRMTNCNSWDIIQQARKTYLVEVKFDTINKIIIVKEKQGQDKGAYFIEDLNLKKLDTSSDSYDFFTRIKPIGKDGLKINVNGKDYLENYQYSSKIKTLIWKDERYTVVENLVEDARIKLEELSKPRFSYAADIIDLAKLNEKYKNILDYSLGDIIYLISKENNIREKQRIVKITEYPDEPERNSCEISNTILTFEDIQKEYQDTVDTVNNITSDNGTISEGAIATAVEHLTIKKLDVSVFTAAEARIGVLEATKANITDLTAINANINNLQANKANITDLTASNMKFNVASGGTLDLQTLLSKFVTGENGQFLNLTTDNVTISNALIKDVIAKSIGVEDLKAGNIDSNRFNIVGTDGNLLIKDNTIQIKDSTRVRVQIGKDASGDYSMYVWDKQGSVMFDALGLKASAIKDKIIRDDMVADNANINGAKLNISSLISEFNKDTNTSLIKASKVAIDLTGQSLDVAFNSLKSSVNGFDERIGTNTTSISVAQGKIEGLIKESAITKSDVTTLKDNYISIKATVDGINTTVASHTTSISTLDGKISKVETKATTVEQGLEGFKVTVSNNYITKTDAENSYATKASMELTANQLKLDFSKTGIANIVPNSSFEDGLNGWNYYTSGGSIVATIVDTTGDNPQSISALRMGVSNFSYTGGYHRFVDLEPDTTYTISAYIRISALTSLPGRSIGIIVNEYSGTTPLGINNLAEYTESTINTSKWVRVTKTFTTGANTNRGQIYCRISNISNGVIYYDNIKLEKGTFATDWTSGENEIYSGNTIIDANGVTIKNGALTIKNKANANVLTSDTNGDLTITGTFINKNSNGVKAVEINNTNIYLYDWERSGRELGIIYSSYLTDYPNVRGFSLAHNQQGYMTLGYRTGTNTFGNYIILDKYSKNPSYTSPIRVLEGTVFSQAVNMQNRVYVPDIVCFEGSYNSTTPQIFKNKGDSRNILAIQVSVSNKDDGLMIQSNTGSVLARILAGYSYPILLNNNVEIRGNYTATGSKNSLQYTEHYGERLINAYETVEYYFGDIGSGVIKEGECIVWIDDILQECINTDVEYHVFTQVYEGKINKIERFKNYFIVYGEDNTKFSWELKAKRIGYENVRLDQPELVGYLDNSVVFTEEEFTVKTSEEILIQELDFKLEDILLEVA